MPPCTSASRLRPEGSPTPSSIDARGMSNRVLTQRFLLYGLCTCALLHILLLTCSNSSRCPSLSRSETHHLCGASTVSKLIVAVRSSCTLGPSAAREVTEAQLFERRAAMREVQATSVCRGCVRRAQISEGCLSDVADRSILTESEPLNLTCSTTLVLTANGDATQAVDCHRERGLAT